MQITDTNRVQTTFRHLAVCPSILKSYSKGSNTRVTIPSGTKTIVKSGYFASVSGFKNDSLIGNAICTMGPFTSNFIIGQNGLFDKNKLRVITRIKVDCESNVMNDIQQPFYYSDKLNKETSIPAFSKNKGGFTGFNIYKLSKDLYNRRHHTSYFKDILNDSNVKSLFPRNTYHHNEDVFEADNQSWVLNRDEDLILFPKFDFFHHQNATHINNGGYAVVETNKPYYQFNLELNYFDMTFNFFFF